MELNSPGNELFSRPVARQLSSSLASFTSVFGMGTGGSPPLESPGELNSKFLNLRTCGMGKGSSTPHKSPSHFRLKLNLRRKVRLRSRRKKSFDRFVQGKLNPLRDFHCLPINLVFCQGSIKAKLLQAPLITSSNLRVGFPIICFQRLSIGNVATRRCD